MLKTYASNLYTYFFVTIHLRCSLKMAIKEFLTPIHEKHSIKEAVITLFLAAPIIKPERFESLIKSEFKDFFQKFENISQVQVNFRVQGKTGVEAGEHKIRDNAGFKFSGFEGGKLVKALQGINDLQRQFISFHTLDYIRWANFYKDFSFTIKEVAKFHPNLFIQAFSLHYIDEFKWISEQNFIPEIIFNIDSPLLPKDVFSSRMVNYSFTTIKKNDPEYFDRIEIKIEKRDINYINISQNILQNLKDNVDLSELVTEKTLEEILTDAHNHNKATLTSVLNPEVCERINLKVK